MQHSVDHDGDAKMADVSAGGQKRGMTDGSGEPAKKKKVVTVEGKNPVMVLNQVMPDSVYVELSQDGPVHERMFLREVEVEGEKFTGKAKGKRAAKVLAAEAALKHLSQSGDLVTGVTTNGGGGGGDAQTAHQKQEDSRMSLRNPVFILSMLQPGLTYGYEQVDAPVTVDKVQLPADKCVSHTCQVTVDEEGFEGAGQNKRIAKMYAAQAALEKVYGLEFELEPQEGKVNPTPVFVGDEQLWKQHQPAKQLKQQTLSAYEEAGEKHPVMEIGDLYANQIKFETHQLQNTAEGPNGNKPMHCSVEAEKQYFEATATSSKLAKFYCAVAVLQYLKDEGLYDARVQEMLDRRAAKVEKDKAGSNPKAEVWRVRKAIRDGTATAEEKQNWEEGKYKSGKEKDKKAKKLGEFQQSAAGVLHDKMGKLDFCLIADEAASADKSNMFAFCVEIEGEKYIGAGRSKKNAKSKAAESALKALVDQGHESVAGVELETYMTPETPENMAMQENVDAILDQLEQNPQLMVSQGTGEAIELEKKIVIPASNGAAATQTAAAPKTTVAAKLAASSPKPAGAKPAAGSPAAAKPAAAKPAAASLAAKPAATKPAAAPLAATKPAAAKPAAASPVATKPAAAKPAAAFPVAAKPAVAKPATASPAATKSASPAPRNARGGRGGRGK